jgi:23S rRNA pseudouridine1911/1915/1917 synthase
MGPLDTGDPSRPGIVHRLDKNTSGAMVVAKNTPAHRILSQQFKNRSVRKEYLALVFGSPSPEYGTIDMPLGRDPKNRKKISTRARRSRSAITNYALEKRYPPFSLLRIHIETGRTHQIRVHLAHRGYPIVGDALYGASKSLNPPSNLTAIIKKMDRPFLHSHRLSFNHPGSGERLTFTAPLPAELQDFLNRILPTLSGDLQT